MSISAFFLPRSSAFSPRTGPMSPTGKWDMWNRTKSAQVDLAKAILDWPSNIWLQMHNWAKPRSAESFRQNHVWLLDTWKIISGWCFELKFGVLCYAAVANCYIHYASFQNNPIALCTYSYCSFHYVCLSCWTGSFKSGAIFLHP